MRSCAASIREQGVILPISVEESTAGMYILHDGERRVKAAKIAGLTEIPAVITPPLNGTGPEQRLVRALVANLQREDLGPMEEAEAYARLRDELGLNNAEIARKLGISDTRVHERLKLLQLDRPLQKLIEAGRLSKDPRVVSALLSIPNPETRVKVGTTIASNGASIKSALSSIELVRARLSAASYPPGEVPALALATRRAGAPNRPIWDAFAQVGRVPPWPLIEAASRKVCDRCGLRDTASITTCDGCPQVELITELLGQTNTESDRHGH